MTRGEIVNVIRLSFDGSTPAVSCFPEIWSRSVLYGISYSIVDRSARGPLEQVDG